MVADYHRQPTGVWRATVTLNDDMVRILQAADPGGALSGVLDELEVIANEINAPLATLHTLDGDPQAWLDLADELDLHRLVE